MNTELRSTVAIVAIVAGASLVAGCGAQGADPLSKPEFIDRANAICQASNDEADPIFAEVWAATGDGDPAVDEQVFALFAEAIDEVMPIFEQQLDDLRALEAPTEDKEFIETLLSDQEAALADFSHLVTAAAGGDDSAREAMDDDGGLFDDIDRRAREYGLTSCGGD